MRRLGWGVNGECSSASHIRKITINDLIIFSALCLR
jgi:hypothetical protein